MSEDNLVQTMGFDASQALNTLKLLDSGFATFNTRLEASAQAMKSFNAAGGTQAAKALSNQATQAHAAASGVNQLVVSWGLLGRVISTQLIVAEFGRLRRVLRDSVSDAIEYQSELAAIQTIAEGSLGSLDDLGASVRGLSDAFNLDLSDSAKATYEALSAQVPSGEVFDFVESAANLAKGGVASLADSVELLAGTMNAFEIPFSQADAVASKFFRTIDLGNVTAEQLTNSFGRISALSAQLGVSFDEQAGGIAVLTNRGLKHNEAATRMVGILSGLLKPTDAMQEALERLGFSQAETAIRTLGLGGVLRSLEQQTDGSAEAIAKLFPNLRGLQGGLILGSQGADQFAAAVDTIKNTSASLNREKALEILATDAQILSSEFNKLKNNLTADIGQRLVGIGSDLVKVGVDADNVSKIVSAFSPVLLTGAGALATYAVATRTATAANLQFIKNFSGGLLLAAGAAAGGDFIGDMLIDAVNRPRREFDALADQVIDSIRQQEAEKLKLLSESDQKRVQAALQNIQQLNRIYIQDQENAARANQFLVDEATRTLDQLVNGRQKYVSALENASRDTERIAEDAGRRIGDLRLLQDDRQFDRGTRGLGDVQKVFALSQRAAVLANQAASALSRARNPDEIQQVQALFQRAQAAGEEAEAIALRTGNRGAEYQAMKAMDAITNQQIAAEQRLSAIQATRRAAIDAEQRKQEDVTRQLRDQAKIVLENSSLFDRDGQQLPADQLAEQQANRAAALQRIAELGLNQSDLKAADALGLLRNLEPEPVDLAFRIEDGLARVQAELRRSFGEFRIGLNFDAANLEAVLGKRLNTPDDIAAGLTEAAERAAELRQSLQSGASDADMARLRIGIQSVADAAGNADRALLRLLGVNTTSAGELAQRVATIRDELTALASSPNIGTEQLTSLLGRLDQLRSDALSGNVAKNVGLAVDLEQFSTALDLLRQLRDAQQQSVVPEGAAAELQRINSLLQTGTFQSSTSAIQQGATAAEWLADSYERAAAASARLGSDPVGRMHGGLMYKAAGGPVGTDTVPAMLSPGEFVVNAASSRRFYSQLSAINAGVQPTTTKGGDSYSTSVGDIHVNGAGSPQATAKEIHNMLKRAHRRGTI